MNSYYKPTPKKWRKLGDSLLAVSLFAATYAWSKDKETVMMISFIIGAIGKFLTNFFTND